MSRTKVFLLSWLGAFLAGAIILEITDYAFGIGTWHYDTWDAVLVSFVAAVLAAALVGLLFSVLVVLVHGRSQPTLISLMTIGVLLACSPDVVRTLYVLANCESTLRSCYIMGDLPMSMQSWMSSLWMGIVYGWLHQSFDGLVMGIAAFATLRCAERSAPFRVRAN